MVKDYHFNSHAHVERDLAENVCQFFHVVISTHTLTWSVTCTIFAFRTCFKNFNSHAHVERDLITFICSSTTGISTHTLTWSVTHYYHHVLALLCHFNSHAHVERDISIFSRFSLFAIFQLTRSRGA